MKNYGPEKFRRITGLRIETYKKCIEILNQKYAAEHAKNVRKSGLRPKLSIGNKLMVTLEYMREYRIYSHIATNYGVHESQIVSRVHRVKLTLIQDRTFGRVLKKFILEFERINK